MLLCFDVNTFNSDLVEIAVQNMPIIKVSDTTIHYSDTGHGKPLELVHGLAATLNMWIPQIEEFSKSYRVIAIDARGVENSGKLKGWTNILNRQVDDLKDLLDHLDVNSAVICGVSYGGVFTQKFALKYPEKCKAIAIFDSYSTTKVRNLKELGWLINVYLGAPANLIPRKWLSVIMRNVYKRWPIASKIMGDIALEYRGFEAMKTRIAINKVAFIPELLKLNAHAPLSGVRTSCGQSSPFMEKCANAIPTCDELQIIPGSYDPSNLCQVQKFNKILHAFLAKVYLE